MQVATSNVRTDDLYSSILSGVPMVVGVKTVKILCSKAVSNPDYQGDKQKKNIYVVKKENHQKN